PSVSYRKLVRMEDKDTPALRAARSILGNFLRSRLPLSPHDVLVDTRQLASATPPASIDRVAPDRVVVRVSAEVAPDASPEALLAAIAAYVEGMGRGPPSERSVARLKQRIAAGRAHHDPDP